MLALGLALVVVGSVGFSTPEPAHAARTVSKDYVVVKQYRSKDLKVCFNATLGGTITARTTQYRGEIWAWSRATLRNPRLTVWSFSCTTGGSRKLKKLVMRQQWSESRCKMNPGISVGYPWQVAVSVTPTCGREPVARRRTSYTKTSGSTQFNGGSPAFFRNGARANNLCFRPTVDFTAYRGNNSDSVKLNMPAVCVRHP